MKGEITVGGGILKSDINILDTWCWQGLNKIFLKLQEWDYEKIAGKGQREKMNEFLCPLVLEIS